MVAMSPSIWMWGVNATSGFQSRYWRGGIDAHQTATSTTANAMPSLARQRGRTNTAANSTSKAKAPAAHGLNSTNGKSNHKAPKAHKEASASTTPAIKRQSQPHNLQITHFIIGKIYY